MLLPCYIKPAGIDPEYLRFDHRIPKENSQDPQSQTGMELSIALCCFPAKGYDPDRVLCFGHQGRLTGLVWCSPGQPRLATDGGGCNGRDGEREHAARLEVKPPLRRHTP